MTYRKAEYVSDIPQADIRERALRGGILNTRCLLSTRIHSRDGKGKKDEE